MNHIDIAIKDCSNYNNDQFRWARLEIDRGTVRLFIGRIVQGVKEIPYKFRTYYKDGFEYDTMCL